MKNKLTLFVLMCLLFLNQNINAQIDLQQGLAAYYPFNGDANDYSGNGNNCTIIGSPALTTDRWGNSDKCYRFNGNGDYMTVVHNPNNQPPIGLSISAWVYCEDFSSWNVVACKRAAHNASPYNSYLLFANGAAGQNQNWSFMIATGVNTTYDIVQSSVAQTGAWVHLVGTYDSSLSSGANLKLYVNGQLASSKQAGGTIYYTDSTLRIGCAIPGPTLQYFKGKIDELRIYNRAINSDEVTALYNNTHTGVEKPDAIAKSFELFPNPAQNTLYLSGGNAEAITVRILDICGRQVICSKVATDGTIDVSSVRPGAYMINVVSANNEVIQTEKLIVNK